MVCPGAIQLVCLGILGDKENFAWEPDVQATRGPR